MRILWATILSRVDALIATNFSLSLFLSPSLFSLNENTAWNETAKFKKRKFHIFSSQINTSGARARARARSRFAFKYALRLFDRTCT